MPRSRAALVALSLSLAVPAAAADLTVGFSICATGPAASLGIPTKNTVALLPATIAGVKVSFVVLDDATDPTTAVKNARKLTSEDAVDVVSILLVEQNARAALQIADEGFVLETGGVTLAGTAAALAGDPRVIETYLGLAGPPAAAP